MGHFMNSLTEIETAIQQLSKSDVQLLSEWLQAHIEEMWDSQIETDLLSGKLDHLINRAEADIYNNKAKSLDEIFDNT